MSGYYERTSESVAQIANRALSKIYGASNDQAIGTVAPTDLSQCMGVIGDSQMLSLAVDDTAGSADVTITLWLWNQAAQKWMYGGANSNDYTKIFVEKGQGGFRVPKGAFYFLTGSIEVESAWVADRAPKVSNQYSE